MSNNLSAKAKTKAVTGVLLLWVALLTSSLAIALPFVVPTLKPLAKKSQLLIRDIPALYHWTSSESLQRLAGAAKDSKFPFEKVIAENTMLARTFPQLSKRKGIFAWVNPIGGIGSSPQEIYAPEAEAALLRFRLKKNLKVLILESQDGVVSQESLDLSKVDVIFHSRQWSFHEFIIINPAAIEEYTGDPAVLKAELHETIEVFKSNNWRDFDQSERLSLTGDLFNHFGKLSDNFDLYVIPRTQAFLGNERNIPHLFKQQKNVSCQKVLNIYNN